MHCSDDYGDDRVSGFEGLSTGLLLRNIIQVNYYIGACSHNMGIYVYIPIMVA